LRRLRSGPRRVRRAGGGGRGGAVGGAVRPRSAYRTARCGGGRARRPPWLAAHDSKAGKLSCQLSVLGSPVVDNCQPTTMPKLTPMLEQYFEIKRQVPDAILFYRLGDFYEMFFEDAEKAAPILDLVLTSRGKGQEHEAPMCGVPYHAADGYIAKLIKQGFRVALCDQVEDPAVAKGIVKREIVRVFTPGTATESALVAGESCYLVALVPREDFAIGAAYLDVSTGDFFV